MLPAPNPDKALQLAALHAGEVHFVGKPCPTCEGSLRYTSSAACVACAKARVTRHNREQGPRRYRWKLDPARTAARDAGQITYIGKPCDACQSPERYVGTGECAHCQKSRMVQRSAADTAPVPHPPTDKRCECCGEIKRLVMDHDHTLEDLGFSAEDTFRGWLCYNCNIGIGRLGDTVQGIERALAYLKKRTTS